MVFSSAFERRPLRLTRDHVQAPTNGSVVTPAMKVAGSA
jgi:hypothetical protein